THDRDYEIVRVDQLLGINAKVFERLHPRGKELGHTSVSPVRIGIREIGACVPLDGGMKRVFVHLMRSIERLVGRAHDLDVPLRHRPTLQTHGFEGLRSRSRFSRDTAYSGPTPLRASRWSLKYSLRTFLPSRTVVIWV